MTELELRRKLKKVVGTRKLLIPGKPLTWNVQQTYFVVYFSIREHRIRRVIRENFKYNKRLKVYWTNISVKFASNSKTIEYKFTLYWKKP